MISKYEISSLQELILLELASGDPLKGWSIFRAVERTNQAYHLLDRIGQSSVYKSIDGLDRRGLMTKVLKCDVRDNQMYVLWQISDEGKQVLRDRYDREARLMDLRIKKIAAIWD